MRKTKLIKQSLNRVKHGYNDYMKKTKLAMLELINTRL